MTMPRELALAACEAADDKKALRPVLIEVEAVSSIADFFVICSGSTPIQVRAIADHIQEKLEALGSTLGHIEGVQQGRWILLDFGVVVVHVMLEVEREFYSLERLWGHGKVETWDAPASSVSSQSL
jgi:ribosome-associated protein